LVIAPSRVQVNGIVGCSDDAAGTVLVVDEGVAIVRRLVENVSDRAVTEIKYFEQYNCGQSIKPRSLLR